MALLRRLLIVLSLSLFACAVAHAQAFTLIDGSQTPLVIAGQGLTVTGWITWHAKYIPEHVVISFDLPAGFVAVNPTMRCTLDDQSTNPNDLSKWFIISYSLPSSNPNQTSSFDQTGASVANLSGGPFVQLLETGVYPCVSWAIQPGNPVFNNTGVASKITAVQLPSSGDAAFLGSTSASGNVTSGGPRVTSSGAISSPTAVPSLITSTAGIADFLSGNGGPAGIRRGDIANFPAAPIATAAYMCVGHNTAGPGNAACNYTIQRTCQNIAVLTGVSATTTQFTIAGGSNQTAKICDVIMSNTNGTAVTASIVAGTGASCTSPTVLLAPVTLSANTGSVPNFDHTFIYPQYSPFASNDSICLTVTGAGSVNATLSYEID